MTVYAIAQLRFIDRAAYDRYQPRFMEVFRRYHGKLGSGEGGVDVIS